MTEYERMGNGGTRPATVTLNNHALVYFKEFLQSTDIVFLVDKRSTRPELSMCILITCINIFFISPTLCINFNIL